MPFGAYELSYRWLICCQPGQWQVCVKLQNAKIDVVPFLKVMKVHVDQVKHFNSDLPIWHTTYPPLTLYLCISPMAHIKEWNVPFSLVLSQIFVPARYTHVKRFKWNTLQLIHVYTYMYIDNT